MRKINSLILFVYAICPAAFAIIVSTFDDTDSIVQKAKDIVVADCVSIPTNKSVLMNGHSVSFGMNDGLYKVEVCVIRTLKGGKQPGNHIIATIYPMDP